MAAFHPGVFYPPSVILFLPDTVSALNLFYFGHYLVLGTFTYLLGKLWGFSFAARIASSMTSMLSGFIIASTLTSNFFLGAVWLPLIFWAYLKYRQEKRIRYFIGTVLAIATQTLAACPEISIMTMVLLYVYTLWFMPREEGLSGAVRITVSLGLAVALALGLSALQLLPTAKLISHSIRDGGVNYQHHSEWSLEPYKLTSLVMSPGYHENLGSKTIPLKFSGLIHTIYMGLIGLTLVMLGFCFRREKVVGFWLLVFFLGIWLALGRYNFLYEYFYSWVPLVKLFRFPEKYFYVSSFAVVFLTGFILDRLTRDPRSIKITPVLTLLILLFGSIALVGLMNPHLEMELSLTLLFIFGLSYTLFYFGKIKQIVFTGLVCFLIVFNLFLKGSQLLPLTDRKFFEEKPMFMDILGESAGKSRIYSGTVQKPVNDYHYPNGPSFMASLIIAKQYLRPYTGMVYGVEHVKGLPGLAMGLKDHILWVEVYNASKPERRLRILKRSNVKYWINQDKLTPYTIDNQPMILPERVEVFQDSLPRAFLVPDMVEPGQGHVLNTYYDEKFDPLKKVVLSELVD
ncbi:MAG: YfhO family protein, partial [Nitrospinota bacterium]|nr:YfhO family protein [Nitrospinota bacterium]